MYVDVVEMVVFVKCCVVVGLCLMIEVNFGDGVFLVVDYFV